MLETEFMKLYTELSKLQEPLQEGMSAPAPNLADCRMISSDVVDIRGEVEASACLDYNGELTRVQVRTVILRNTSTGKEFLGRNYGRRVSLPGGGYDASKDHGDILETAQREAYEEFNLLLTNVENTGIGTWRHRDDPWVKRHVQNTKDQWTGYYSYYVVGEVAGEADNDKPEEINKWTWLPVEKLQSVNKELYAYVTSLDEAIHPDKKARTDLGEISYLCNSLATLRKILTSMEIQKTYVPEVRYEVGEQDGNAQRVKQMSLSTSRNLVGHAKRRPDKWGFGVILDGPELSRYYRLEPYNHADHKLPTLKISKIVKLKHGVFPDSDVIIGLCEYGNRLISNKDGADLRIYELLRSFLRHNPEYLEKAKTLEHNYISAKDPTKWSNHPFGYEKNTRWCDTRFTKLTVDQIEEIYAWEAPFSKNAIPLKTIKDFNQSLYDELIRIFKQYSSFEEEEERIWVENNLINFVQIPKTALAGIILPDFFKEDYDRAEPTNYHIAWLKNFVTSNNLRVDWHEFQDNVYYQKELEANDAKEKEVVWSAVNKGASAPRTVLNRAIINKNRLIKGMISEQEKEQASPSSVVATAAVKLAIAEHMQDLTNDNYAIKYQAALDAAEKYYAETLVKGRLTAKPKGQIEDLFNYYCPDAPGTEDMWVDNDTFDQEFPNVDTSDNSEKETLVASL